MNKLERKTFKEEYMKAFLKKVLFMYLFFSPGIILVLIGLLASPDRKTLATIVVLIGAILMVVAVIVPIKIFFDLKKKYKTKK